MALSECEGPDGRQLATVTERRMHQVVQSPDSYRVVSQEMADEYAAMCRRHEAEIDAYWARLLSAPKFKVTVTLENNG